MRRPLAPKNAGTAGFTLVELLVALAVLGLILVALAGGIRFGSRAWEASADRSAAFEDVANVQLFLRQRISEIVPLSTESEDSVRQIGILGDASQLRFVARWLSPVGAGGLYLFEMGATLDKGLGVSWSLLHPELAERAGLGPDGERVLLAGIRTVSIRYFGDPEFADTPGWQTSWTDPVFLPRLIAIDVEFAPDDPRSWPTLVVAPQALAVAR